MTKKQLRKLAQQIAEQEKIHQNSESQDERDLAEKRIFQLTEQILTMPHGLEVLDEVDEMVQKIL